MTEYLKYALKGLAMGIANVIPGVSGGTIALITNIFERLINAFKSFNLKAIKLLFSLKFKEFAAHTDLYFLLAVFFGVGVAIVSVARIFAYLFEFYPVYIWSYFFGLILASVYFVGRTITKFDSWVVIFFIAGTAIAVALTYLNPATENSNPVYLVICGVAAICSMILPGISGSFILVLMGNYQLVAIEAINDLRLDILLPVMIGAVVGLIAFSHFLSWVFRKFRNVTISLLTGFILGSLGIIWPWKNNTYLTDASGEIVLKGGKAIVTSFKNYMPDAMSQEVLIAVLIMVAGIITIWLTEMLAVKKS